MREGVQRPLAVGWLLLFATTAFAAPVYYYQFDQSNYSVAPGGGVDVTVFLVEDTSGGGSSLLVSEGLLSGGVRLSYSGVNSPDAATLTSKDAIAHNPAFDQAVDNPVKYLTADFVALGSGAGNPIAGLAETRSDAQLEGVLASELDPNHYRIPLGTFHFTAGNVMFDVTTLKAGDLFPGDAYVVTSVTGQELELSPYGIDTATATISVVPEPPGTVALVGLTVMGVLLWTVRGRRRVAAA